MRLLLLTSQSGPAANVLPAVELLTHSLRVLPAEGSALLDAPPHDAILVEDRGSCVAAAEVSLADKAPKSLILRESNAERTVCRVLDFPSLFSLKPKFNPCRAHQSRPLFSRPGRKSAN